MNELKIFENSEFGQVRTIIMDNQPWFVGKDIADILKYGNHRQAIKTNVDDEDKAVHSMDTLGGNQKITIINESGLYSLILSSKLSSAKTFKKWVTSEVLPTIRKHGLYATTETTEKILDNPDFLIKALETLKAEREERRRLEAEVAQKSQIIGELQPKANYVDAILNNKGLVTITQIAKDYGMSGREMNALLHRNNVQYKESGQWLLYKQHHDKGYTHSKTIEIQHKDGTNFVKMNTKWTQKGRLFIYELLKKQGVLPVIEQQEQSA